MIYVGFALAVLGGLLAGVATTLAALNWAWQRGATAWDLEGDE